jgi:hypothetical protein
METLGKLGERLLELLIARSFGYALVLGFWVSLASTLITMIMLNQLGSLDHGVPRISHGGALLTEFFLLFVVVTAVSVLMSLREDQAKEREKQVAEREAAIADRETKLGEREREAIQFSKLDVLSGFRGKLEGVWSLEYRSSSFNDEGDVVDEKGTTYARFLVDEETKKLRLLVNVREGDYWESDNLIIEAISVWPVSDPKHLDYFHDLRLTMERGEIVRGPVFVHLDIDFEDGEPIRLSGTWYDLDGVFAKARREQWQNRQKPTKGDLSLRGRIVFRRIDLAMPSKLSHASPQLGERGPSSTRQTTH